MRRSGMTSANSKTGSHTAHIKSSYLNSREYDEPQMHKRFTAICEAMHARTEKELGFEPSHVTARSLSLLTGNLRAFVESALGRNSNPATRSITKFPHKLFYDYRPDGALYNMLCVCLNFKYLHGLRRIEFSNMDKRGFNFDLLGRIEKSLRQARLLPRVQIYLAPSLPSTAQSSIRAIVQKRGEIVSSPSAATHIVYPDPPGTTVAETAGTDYCRPLELKEAIALVHWWYYPDSYDSWIPRADVDGEPDPPEDHKGPWHVQMRWVEDTELYNEWMNPADYEIPVESRIAVVLEKSSGAASIRDHEVRVEGSDERENVAKISKKRKRVSPTKPLGPSEASLSKSGTKRGLLDEMDLGDSSSDSEDKKASRPSRRGTDIATKDHSTGKDTLDFEKETSPPEVLHHSKRARLSEEGKKAFHKNVPQQSVKVRLSIKAPKEKSKSRYKERMKEEKKREEAKAQRRETSAESRGGAGLKVRVKLDNLSGFSSKEIGRAEAKLRDSDNDDAMSTQATPVDTVPVQETGRKSDRDHRDRVTARNEGESAARTGNRTSSKAAEKTGLENDVNNPDGAQEQKRPFSRRKSRKKERSLDMKRQGVTVVDDAVPLPEGELPRIRNISNEGTDVIPGRDGRSRHSNLELSESMDVDNREDGRADKDKENGHAMNGEVPGDVDVIPTTRRVVAISEKMLDGDEANAPASAADLMASAPESAIRMPSHSRWFRMDAVHDIEKRSLSEFFNGRSESKTPLVYKKYRDFMIDVWRQAPDKYLTSTSVRRHLAGDVCAILRVHALLEHWGLINYGTEPESKPFLGSSLRARYSRPRPVQLDGNLRDQGNGVPRLLFFDDPRPQRREGPPVSLHKTVRAAKEKSGQPRTPSLLSRRELYAIAAATKYECDGCGSDCSRMRYHCVGNADIELCPSCFANGVYPETLSARDFEQLTTVLGSEAHDGSVWSEAEVLLLLEGLEKFGDDWNQVSEHVGTKTNEQCVLQFLRMPIEDSFLGDQLGKWDLGPSETINADVTQEGKCDGDHKFAGPLLPFADTANPVMAQVAFLASSVSPEVAAAAAQAALHALMSETGRQSTSAGEGRTAQAKALLTSSAEKHRIGENGVSDGTTESGSKLGSLPPTKLDAVAVEAAATVGLAAAVSKAKVLADAESREIERAFAIAVETKLRIVDMKLQEFDRLEQHMRRERDRLEKQRQNVYADRVEAALMRTASPVQASRVAAAHEAAASVAAGVPVRHVYTGPTITPSGGSIMIGTPNTGTGMGALVTRPSEVGRAAVQRSVDSGANK